MFSKITWLIIPLMVMVVLFTACGGEEVVDEVETTPELALPEQEPGPGPELEEMTEAEAAEPGQITQPGDQELLTQGERLFRDHCAACHRQNGEGQGQLYPALNNNPFVTNQSPLPVISTVLHGRGAMPSFRNAFSERQVAAVVSYIRNAWNNDASLVGVDEVGPVQATAAQQDQSAAEATPAEEEAAAAPTGEGDAGAGEGEQAAEEATTPEATGESEEGEQPADEEVTPEATAEGEQPEDEEATPEPAGEAEDGADAEELINQGQQVYAANCAACHGPEGQGGGVFPALAGNEFLTGDPTQAIQVVLHGRGAMPPFGGTLSNEQIAAVLSYERNSWGNEAEVITPEQVTQAAEGSE